MFLYFRVIATYYFANYGKLMVTLLQYHSCNSAAEKLQFQMKEITIY